MSIEARLNRAHGALTTLTNGRHAWTSDVGKQLGSNDAAPDAHELLDSALAACTALTLELYIRRKQLAVRSLRVEVEHVESKGEDGRVRYALARRLHIEGELSAAERERLAEIADRCPVHRILTGEISITTALAE
ncbi:MAG: OsmC family protein [Planctomycetes bacterium]|nr:OsmC family protein [Planctomycetota bacterium]